jgi:hypothetical protein
LSKNTFTPMFPSIKPTGSDFWRTY